MKQKELDIILEEHKKWLGNGGGKRADLREADLQGADLPNFLLIPEEGGFYAWKSTKGHIAKIYISADVERACSLVGRKCRASRVKTIKLYDKEGNPVDDKESFGKHDGKTKYTVGEYTYPDKFDDDIRVECTHDIHFFITKKEAMEW